jgi:hypothetical protein
MNIELKKISFNERMSEETNCFVADLYIDGKKVGYCKNNGHGGCTDIHGNSKDDFTVIAKAKEYCKTLPKEKMFGKEFEQTLEDVVDKKLEEYLKAKQKAKAEKKMLKQQLTGILFGVPDGDRYSYYNYKQPLDYFSTSALQTLVNQVRDKHCTDGVEILNTNLKELGVTL